MIKAPVVLDTNVYLSGIIFGGNCRHILDLVIGKKIKAAMSPAILLEISQKLAHKFNWRPAQVLATIKTIIKATVMVRPQIKVRVVKADKSDDKIIEAAVAGGAKYIVSGDRHLLQLKQYRQIKMVTPQEFLAIYFKKHG